MEKREEVKKQIESYLKKHELMNREVAEAYYYDGCELVFTFYNPKNEKNYLGNTTFNYWKENVMVGKNFIQEEWEKLLEELGIRVPVNTMQYCEYSDYINLIGSDFELEKNIDNENANQSLFKTELVGTQYEGRNERIEKVKIGDKVKLIREPDNKYDSNAIDVHNDEGTLGHIPSDVAYNLAQILDNGHKYVAEVSNVVPLSQRSKKCKSSIIEIEIKID